MTPTTAQVPATVSAGTDTDTERRYRAHVNPQWVRLLEVLGMKTSFAHCEGAELFTRDGRKILDCLSGYCVYNMGHNHPDIIAELEAELHRHGPTMLQSHVPELAANLAEKLCQRATPGLEKVFFTSSGSEGIETVIKFARYHTRRPGILYCDGSFHGLTNGALSLMGNPWWREGFGPLLADAQAVPFGDLDALAAKLADESYAVFVVEPVQAEAGICVPSPEYLAGAETLCKKHGTLFALDEVQTGMYRTGPFLAAHHFGLEPDFVVLAKGLSGGFIPCGAVLMTDAVYRSVYNSLSRAFIHASTFGENSMSMRAGLATLGVMDREQLGARAERLGKRLRHDLRARIGEYEMVQEIRGLGLLNGIVFREPTSLKLRTLFKGFKKAHEGMFGQILVSQLFGKQNVLTQMCGNNHMVLKVAPPLMVDEPQLDLFVDAIDRVLEQVHTRTAFWVGGLAMVPRAARI